MAFGARPDASIVPAGDTTPPPERPLETGDVVDLAAECRRSGVTRCSGTGETTVALRTADLLKRLGYLERGHLLAAGREDLAGQYVGHTAPKRRTATRASAGTSLRRSRTQSCGGCPTT
jgi:hypothetical protein